MLAGGAHRFALPGYGAGVVSGTPGKPVPSVVVSRVPHSTSAVVAREWAEELARGRNGPWFGATATLVRTTATTDAAGGTRTLLSDRLAWLVLMPDEQVVSSGKVGPFKWAFTRAVLIDATSGDYLGGALLPSSDWR